MGCRAALAKIAEQVGVDTRALCVRELDLEPAEYDELHKRLGSHGRRALDDLRDYAAPTSVQPDINPRAAGRSVILSRTLVRFSTSGSGGKCGFGIA